MHYLDFCLKHDLYRSKMNKITAYECIIFPRQIYSTYTSKLSIIKYNKWNI